MGPKSVTTGGAKDLDETHAGGWGGARYAPRLHKQPRRHRPDARSIEALPAVRDDPAWLTEVARRRGVAWGWRLGSVPVSEHSEDHPHNFPTEADCKVRALVR